MNLSSNLLLSVSLALGVVGCSESNFSGDNKKASPPKPAVPAPNQIFEESFSGITESVSSKVDVVIAIDTSGSMTEEADSLSQNLAGFLQNLLTRNVDAHVTLIAGKLTDQFGGGGRTIPGLSVPEVKIPAGLPSDRFGDVKQYVDSNNAISVLNNFFSGKLQPMPMRLDGALEVVVISDDNGKGAGNLASDFVKPAYKQVHFNGIAGLTATSTATCDIVEAGTEYQTLATQTGGSMFDLCSPDWTKLTEDLSKSIVSRVGNAFKLKYKANLSKEFIVKVNGAALMNNEFVYDANAQSLTITKQLGVNDQVAVSYWPE